MAKDGRSNRVLHENGMKYANNMQEICKEYARNMQEICIKYARKYARNMLNMQEICMKYAS